MQDRPGPLALSQWIDVDPAERSPAKVGAVVGVSDQTVRNWRSGATAPTDPGHRMLLGVLLGQPSLALSSAWSPEPAPPSEALLPPGMLGRVIAYRDRCVAITEIRGAS